MEIALVALIIVLAAAIIVIVLKRPTEITAEQRQAELQNLIQQSTQQQLQTILQQLNQHQSIQQNSASQLQSRVAETSRVVYELQSKLSTLAEGNKRILDMSKGITDLQNILQAPKLRGERGEMWLEELLAQMIPRANFKIQHHFKTGEICDAVILLRDNLLLPIDSKFSLENFKKMIASEDPTEEKAHEKVFCADIKKRIDEIAKKYILPAEGTLDFAFMYIPAENVYYQAFVEDRGGSQLQRYAYERHVIPVSPNSLYPYLEIVMFGLKGLEIEKGAKEIQQSLRGLHKELGKFEEEYRKVGTHLRNAQNSYEQSDKRLATFQGKLGGINAQELIEPISTIIEIE